MFWDCVAVLFPNNRSFGGFNLFIDLLQGFSRGLLMDVYVPVKHQEIFSVCMYFSRDTVQHLQSV